jgi:tRNA-dihydrouridine synthase
LEERFAIIRRQISESISRIDDYRGILHIRRHLAASPLFKGIPNFRETRIAMLRADNFQLLSDILDNIYQRLTQQNISQTEDTLS